MHILHVIDSLGLGGAQVLVKGLLYWGHHGDRHELFALRQVAPMIDFGESRRSVFASTSKYSMKPLLALHRFISDNDIEVIHAHLWRSLVFSLVVSVFAQKRVSVVYHEHGQICGNEGRSLFATVMYRATIAVAYLCGVTFIAVSDFALKKLLALRCSQPDRTFMMRNFSQELSLDQSYVYCKARESKDQGTFVFGFAGRIEEIKGWREFLQAAIILRANSSVEFVIAGCGSEDAELQKCLHDYKLERVRYLGYVADMSIDFFSQIDCLVVPSHNEPLGLMPLEAYAHSVAVIAANTPGLNEIVNHEVNGLLFRAKSVEHLVETMVCMQSDAALREKLVESARSYIKNFGIAQYADRLHEIYAGMCRSNTGGTSGDGEQH